MSQTAFTFSRDGFEVWNYLSPGEFSQVKAFALGSLNALFEKYAKRTVGEEEVLNYHRWCDEAKVPHSEMLRAKNRHLTPPDELKSLLLNSGLKDLLERIGVRKFKLWDEGLGWLAFRLIRPRPGDGYPFSCKFWGPAKQVYSIWIPIVGFSQEGMLHLIPGSHQKEYPKYLPKDTHFTKDEYRLDLTPSPKETCRPQLKQGEAILFHPKTLHAEEIENGTQTRFSLEFRIEP